MYAISTFFKSVLSYLGLWNKKANLLFLGLDNAGKSTLLHMLKTGKFTQTAPTQYPNSETLQLGNTKLNTFDLGGHEAARKLWKDYVPAVDCLFFVVDAANSSRFAEVKEELLGVLAMPELAEIPVAILGNKIDMKGAVSEEELRDALDLNSIFAKETRPIELFMTSVAKKTGYPKALEWVDKLIKDK